MEEVKSVCPIASAVAKEVLARAETGLAKYGVNADRDDLTLIEWLQHQKEELLDAAVYIEKTIKELKKETSNVSNT